MSIRDERKQQSRQALLDAALQLSTAERSFSNLSLREITREVGLVPTAFYRHFQDMDALGQELVDQVALHIKSLIQKLGRSYLQHNTASSEMSIKLFVKAVDHSPLEWQFMIAERWGGSVKIRQAIAAEIDDLVEGLANTLIKIPSFEHIQNVSDLKILSTILINMSFTWAMTWLNLVRIYEDDALLKQQELFIENASTQVRLIFRGISNWE